MTSKVTRILSVISLLDMNALWFSPMMVGKTTFSLLARTFEAILDMTLKRLIGRYSGIFLGALNFRDKDYMCYIKLWWRS